MEFDYLVGNYIFDGALKSYGSFFRVERVLADFKSPYQRITVFDTEDAGRILMLDHAFNVSTAMEAFYHEPMAHIPLAMVPEKARVLIVGGGDFGVAKHVLKHRDVGSLELCELDQEVIETTRRYFSEWAEICETDPRFTLHIGDGSLFLRECADAYYDAIIVDSTDPFGPAPMLISESFYGDVRRTLKPHGAFMQIMADTVIFTETWDIAIPRVRRNLAKFAPVLVPIPFYVSGTWGLLLAGKDDLDLDPKRITADYLGQIGGVETMAPALSQGWFSLPPYFQRQIDAAR